MKYLTVILLGVGITLIAVWAWVVANQETPITTNDLSTLFAGWAFLAAFAALIHSVTESNRGRTSTNETLFLQAISSQMNAYATLAEHAPDKLGKDFERRLVVLGNEFEFAKYRAAERLGIKLP